MGNNHRRQERGGSAPDYNATVGDHIPETIQYLPDQALGRSFEVVVRQAAQNGLFSPEDPRSCSLWREAMSKIISHPYLYESGKCSMRQENPNTTRSRNISCPGIVADSWLI